MGRQNDTANTQGNDIEQVLVTEAHIPVFKESEATNSADVVQRMEVAMSAHTYSLAEAKTVAGSLISDLPKEDLQTLHDTATDNLEDLCLNVLQYMVNSQGEALYEYLQEVSASVKGLTKEGNNG